MKRKVAKKFLNIGIALLLPVGLYIILAIFSEGRFGTLATVLSVLRTSIVPLLIGMGMSFNMKMDMWDFASGGVVYAAAIFAANLAVKFDLGIWFVCVSAMIIALLMSGFSGFLYNKLRIPAIVLSLGLAMVYEALPNLLIPTYTGKISIMDSYLARSPWCFIIVVIMFIIFHIIYYYTVLGRNIQAIGANIAIANNAGINLDRTKFFSFLLAGLFLGVAAIIFLSVNVTVTAVSNFMSSYIIFDAMIGVFIGVVLSNRISYSFAIVIGILTTRMLSTGLVAIGLSSQARTILTGTFLFVLLAFSANQGRFTAWQKQKQLAKKVNNEINVSLQ